MLIYLVFNNLTIIFQVPRLLRWQCPGPPPHSPSHPTLLHHKSGDSVPICSDLSSLHISEDLPWLECHNGSSAWSGCSVNLVRSTLWAGPQSCLGDSVCCLCLESQGAGVKVWLISVALWPSPVQSWKRSGLHAYKPPSPLLPRGPGPLSASSFSLVSRHFSYSCRSSGATPCRGQCSRDAFWRRY